MLRRPEFPGQRSCCVEQSAGWVRSPDMSLDIFKDKLKTFLFGTVYKMRICGIGEFARYKSHYYYYYYDFIIIIHRLL